MGNFSSSKQGPQEDVNHVISQRFHSASSSLSHRLASSHSSRLSRKGIENDDDYFSNDSKKYLKEDARKRFDIAFENSKLLSCISQNLRHELFLHSAVPVFVSNGDMIFQQNDLGNILFVLIEGELDEIKENPVTKKKKKHRIEKEMALAEFCVFNMQARHEFTCVAKSYAFLLAIHRVQFQLTRLFYDYQPNQIHRSSFLKKIPLFATLNEGELKNLESKFVIQTFEFNERIIAPKQKIPGFFIIEAGQVVFRGPPSEVRTRPNLESKFSFPEAEHNDFEWLSRGDYFGQQMLFDSDVEFGVSVISNCKSGTRVLTLSQDAWQEFSNPSLRKLIRGIHLRKLMNNSLEFSALSESQIFMLSSNLEFNVFSDGEVILPTGNSPPSEAVYMLEQGAINLYPVDTPQKVPSVVEMKARAKQIFRESSKQSVNSSFLHLGSDIFGEEEEVDSNLDHCAMLTSLGIGNPNSVVLLPGEVFQNVKNSINVIAIGRVSLCVISLQSVKSVGLEGFSGLIQKNSTSRGHLHIDPVFSKFLNFELLQEAEGLAQTHSNGTLLEHQLKGNLIAGFRCAGKRLLQVKKLHETPMVWVSICLHAPSNQYLVVKELNVSEANRNGMSQYVLREQVILAQLGKSPFISNLTASWEEPERLYLTLELALLGDLRLLLYKTGENPSGEAGKNPKRGELGGFELDLMTFLAGCMILALKHLFEHRVLHRDIKPNNWVMDHLGYCKLIDFGISKRLVNSCGDRTQTLVGSPKYMSPELYKMGYSYTNSIDWWALGITLFELATGRLPYSGDPSEKIPLYWSENINCLDWYSSSSWFLPFRGIAKWEKFGHFISRLLDPDADRRLGGSTTPRGPRGAIAHPAFDSLSFRDLSNQLIDPVPFFMSGWNSAIVNCQTTAAKSLSTLQTRLEKKSGFVSLHPRPKLTRASHELPSSSFTPPKLSIETKVRSDLENPECERTVEAFNSSDLKQKQMILAREQHIRKTAFKEGQNLSELSLNSNLDLLILQRASVFETLQVIHKGEGGNRRLRNNYFATIIQRFWKRRIRRRNLSKEVIL